MSPEGFPQADWPHFQTLIKELLAEGLIVKEDGEWIDKARNKNVYRTTRKGDAYVFMLCQLPPPQECFCDAAGKPIRRA